MYRNTLTPNIDLGQDPGVSSDSIILLAHREPEVQLHFEFVFEEMVPWIAISFHIHKEWNISREEKPAHILNWLGTCVLFLEDFWRVFIEVWSEELFLLLKATDGILLVLVWE